jgi:hypothetical protein
VNTTETGKEFFHCEKIAGSERLIRVSVAFLRFTEKRRQPHRQRGHDG